MLLTDWAEQPNDPSNDNFVGAGPFLVQTGVTPDAVGFKPPRLDAACDSLGLYRLS